jgi:hypothetical protein
MRVLLFLVLLLGGNLLLVAGVFVTRLTWRPEAEAFGRGSPILQCGIIERGIVEEARHRRLSPPRA